ncbi:MAG TPA: SIR2 family protein [Candidatus Udaeobacter sp.]|nr:SIR2 family protein [Candidatus Udaeobacter sp.]
MADIKWNLLVDRIKNGKCTPFLGAGACADVLPVGGAVAENWAQTYGYPLNDSHDLIKVAQYVAVTQDPMWPKEEIIRAFNKRVKEVGTPDFGNPLQPHALLADLALPVYLTTNYDDFMEQALRSRKRDPQQALCRWNDYLEANKDTAPSAFDESSYKPDVDKPVVFHLHGHSGVPESLVLTEDDYLDFMVSISRNEELLPPPIRKALAGTTLLFLGYAITDWDFRVLFRSLVSYLSKSVQRGHVSVQLDPGASAADAEKAARAQNYLNSYFAVLNIDMFWGTCEQFVAELRRRWEAAKDAK